MPVLINSQNQLAEDLPDDQATLALNQGTHQLPLNDPQGNATIAPLDKAQSLLSEGYSQPSSEQLTSLLNHAKYSSIPEQIKTGLEGAASGATFGLSTGAERLAGVEPEAIQARHETNPGVHALGEAAGLLGSMATGVGEGAGIAKAGQLAAKALGLEAAQTVLAKVGSAAAKGFVENALVASGDEVSRAFAKDPEQSAQSAIINVGLGGLLGGVISGGLGTTSPLWKAANETQVGKFLSVIRNKANGVGKETLPSADIQDALQTTGIDLPNEMKAALSENPEARAMFQELQESSTRAGKEASESYQSFRKKASDAALSAVGKTPADLDSIATMSDHDVGTNLKDSISSEFKRLFDPLTVGFEKVKAKFAPTPITTPEISNLGNDITKMAQDQGYGILEGTNQGKLINKILDSLPNVKALEDLRKLQSQIGEQTQNPEMWGLGKGLKGIFRNAEENIVEAKLGAESPELLAEHRATRSGYREVMELADQVDDRLHVGKYSGPSSFLKNLSEMNPEDVLRRLTPKNDASLLPLLAEKFPLAAQSIRESFLNQALKQATSKAFPGESMSLKSFFNVVNKWSPEVREFALSKESAQQLSAIESLMDQLPTKLNTSGTAKTLDALWSHIPGGVGSMVSLMTGHNPVLGYVMGQLGKYVGREIPDAMKLATLKFLGSDLPINSSGFRALAEFASHSIESQKMMKKGVSAVFKSGRQVFPQMFHVNASERKKLDQAVQKANEDPEKLLDTGGDTPYYLPEEGASLASVAARAINYLSSLKPSPTQIGILDDELQPSEVEKERYDRALNVAQQPLSILPEIQQGTLLPEDVITLKTIYPKVYDQLSNQLTQQMIDLKSKDKMISYPTRISMSLFLMQPLDSTLTPEAIQSAQMTYATNVSPTQNESAPQGGRAHSMKSLTKLPGMSLTTQQAREQTKATV